jgi:hypothetical protein
MWMRFPHNPSAYDDDWEDQPAQSWFHKWVLGAILPVLIFDYGFQVILRGQAQIGNPVEWTIQGINALAYAMAVLSAAVFLHFHYFWGNIYDQIWFAVLGKILSASGFIISLAFLCIRVGVLGRR